MGMTIAEKILARASARHPSVRTRSWLPESTCAMSHENADLVRKSFPDIGVSARMGSIQDRHHFRPPHSCREREDRDHTQGCPRVRRGAGHP